MATQITSTALESGIADAIVTALGANCQLRLLAAGDVEVATMTGGTAAKNTTPSPDQVDITGLADDTSATGGTVVAAVLETTGGAAEIIRFTDPVNDIGLSSATITAGQTVTVNSFSLTVPA